MGAPAGLLFGSVGLLYSHYFSALFLPALGLFHLLFMPKNRRWWQPVLLLGLAAWLATAQLPGFLEGLKDTAADGDLHNRALSATALFSRFVRFMTNGLASFLHPCELLLLCPPATCAGACHPATVCVRYQDQSAPASWLNVPDRSLVVIAIK